MQMFQSLPLWGNLAVFAIGAVLVWRAGTHLSRGADAVSDRTGLGQAFVGALLLGGVTSLPEIAATVSASIIGDPHLAVNNIFGGIAMQVTILAIADRAGSRALTGENRKPGVLLEGILLILVLNTAAVAIEVGDILVFGVGVWTTALFGLVVAGMFLIKEYGSNPRWKPVDDEEDGETDDQKKIAEKRRKRLDNLSTRKLVLQMTVSSLVVLAGGFAVAKASEGIARQTGLGSSFVGAVLLAIATSLPEISTTLEAVRLGARAMAISNIFGTNLFDAGLLFVADISYSGEAVLNEMGSFSQIAALLGLACTAIYLVGIVERRERTVLRLGVDSIVVVLVYAAGLGLLYTMR